MLTQPPSRSRARTHIHYPWICNTNLWTEQSRTKNSEIPNGNVPSYSYCKWIMDSDFPLRIIMRTTPTRCRQSSQLRLSESRIGLNVQPNERATKTTFQLLLWPRNMKCARSGDGIISDRRERTSHAWEIEARRPEKCTNILHMGAFLVEVKSGSAFCTKYTCSN